MVKKTVLVGSDPPISKYTSPELDLYLDSL